VSQPPPANPHVVAVVVQHVSRDTAASRRLSLQGSCALPISAASSARVAHAARNRGGLPCRCLVCVQLAVDAGTDQYFPVGTALPPADPVSAHLTCAPRAQQEKARQRKNQHVTIADFIFFTLTHWHSLMKEALLDCQ